MRLILLAFLLLTACTEISTVPSAKPVFPRAQLQFSVEGAGYTGTAVVQRKVSQKIIVSIPKGSPYFFFTTCHREITFNNPDVSVTYMYVPTFLLENTSSCVAKLTAISPQGVTSLGFIDFTSEEDLTFRVYCNGNTYDTTNGVALCQSRAGLMQKVSFTKPAEMLAAQGCEQPVSNDGYSFTFPLTAGLCIYAIKSNNQYGRLTTYGYTEL